MEYEKIRRQQEEEKTKNKRRVPRTWDDELPSSIDRLRSTRDDEVLANLPETFYNDAV